MYYVYVLKSLTNNRCYTGSTDNVDRRLNEHNSGGSKYTRFTKPFILVYKEEFSSRSEAFKREMFFKSGKGRELLKHLISND